MSIDRVEFVPFISQLHFALIFYRLYLLLRGRRCFKFGFEVDDFILEYFLLRRILFVAERIFQPLKLACLMLPAVLRGIELRARFV